MEGKSAGMVLASLFPSLGIGCNAICNELSRKTRASRNLKVKEPSLHKILTITH